MNPKRIIGIVVLLLVGAGLVGYRLHTRQAVIDRNAAVARENAAIAAENAKDAEAAAKEAAEEAAKPVAAPVAEAESVAPTAPGFVSATPVTKEAQLKLAEELIAKASELWKAGNREQSVAAGDAALAIYEAQFGTNDERTVKLKVQTTRAKMELMAPPDRK